MAKLQWKGGTLLAPVPPALITCGTNEKPNIFTVAWTGIINSEPPKTYISVRPSRFSYELIKSSGEFVINLTTEPLVRAADYCGVYSGRNKDKFRVCALTAEISKAVTSPSLAESPLSLECRVFDTISLGTHDMFLADIVAVCVDENLVDASGKLHLEKCNLVSYIHGAYYEMGKKLGSFGFSVKKKK